MLKVQTWSKSYWLKFIIGWLHLLTQESQSAWKSYWKKLQKLTSQKVRGSLKDSNTDLESSTEYSWDAADVSQHVFLLLQIFSFINWPSTTMKWAIPRKKVAEENSVGANADCGKSVVAAVADIPINIRFRWFRELNHQPSTDCLKKKSQKQKS